MYTYRSITDEAVQTFGGVEMIIYAVVAPPKPTNFQSIEVRLISLYSLNINQLLMSIQNASAALNECMKTNYFCCVWAYHASQVYLKRYKGHFVAITSIEGKMMMMKKVS